MIQIIPKIRVKCFISLSKVNFKSEFNIQMLIYHKIYDLYMFKKEIMHKNALKFQWDHQGYKNILRFIQEFTFTYTFFLNLGNKCINNIN